MKRLIGIAGLALLLWHQSVSAELISMDFKFIGVDVAPPGGPTADVTFMLSYDSNTPDTDPSNPDVGTYAASVVLATGGESRGPENVTVQVSNGVPAGPDEFAMLSAFFAPISIDGVLWDNAGFSLNSNVGIIMFSSDALPLTPQFASQADLAFLTLGMGDVSEGLTFDPGSFQVTSPNVAPEPPSYPLLIVGLAGILAVRRARRGSAYGEPH